MNFILVYVLCLSSFASCVESRGGDGAVLSAAKFDFRGLLPIVLKILFRSMFVDHVIIVGVVSLWIFSPRVSSQGADVQPGMECLTQASRRTQDFSRYILA